MRARFAIFTIKNGVAACLMIAALSLLAVEAIGPAHALVLAAAILWGRWRGGASGRPILWDLLAMGALLLFPFDLFALSRSLIGAALRLLSFVVIYRCSNLTGRRELRQAVALSFVQILAAAASTTEAYFGLLLAAYLSMAVWTLMAMASARDDAPPAARRAPSGRPVAVMTASTMALGAAVFFVLPHFGTGYLQQASTLRGASEGLSGFSERIELGSISRIKRNRAIVMRVTLVSGGRSGSLGGTPLRWRGLALDTFDGRSWSLSRPDAAWLAMDADGWYTVGAGPASREEAPGAAGASDPGSQEAMIEQISMEPSLTSLLFVPPGATRVFSDDIPGLGLDTGGSVHMQVPALRRFGYRVVSPETGAAEAGFGLGPAPDLTRYLGLPRLEPRVGELARRVTQSAGTDLDKARAIEAYLRANYAYTLQVDDAGVADPLAHFLIEKHPGHCEYFATAMAIMLRHLGIPSRVVNGFSGGEWSELAGAFIVRQSDAHSWVETWIDSRGWVTFDPTPAGAGAGTGLLASVSRALDRAELFWDTWIIGLDLLDQQSVAVTVMEAAGRAAGALSRALASTMTVLGWAAASAAGLLLGAACWFLARSPLFRRLWPRRGGLPGHRGAPSPATELLRRFEARWAARGVRRAPGQTPLEFAREIERRALDTPGASLRFIRGYYQARFGASGDPRASS